MNVPLTKGASVISAVFFAHISTFPDLWYIDIVGCAAGRASSQFKMCQISQRSVRDQV